MERVSIERLQAMLDFANRRAKAEDCLLRLENRKLVLSLDNSRRVYILSAWGGDQY